MSSVLSPWLHGQFPSVGIVVSHWLGIGEAWVMNIGLLGTINGGKIVVGGTSGIRPPLADLLVEGLPSGEEALVIVENIAKFYRAFPKKVRIGRIIEEIGIDSFREAVLC